MRVLLHVLWHGGSTVDGRLGLEHGIAFQAVGFVVQPLRNGLVST